MASHEFRTPLSTILTSAYLLDKYNEVNTNSNIDKHVKRIKGAVSGMKGILEDFLSLGKLEEGHVQTNTKMVTRTTIDSLFKNLMQELDALLKNGQQIVYTNSVATIVCMDTNLVTNILTNLISNAIKFSPEKGIVRVTSFVKDDNFIITVEDNGIGISEEDQQHLFERFFRAKNAMNIQGTGLGLHIVSKYLELMNGRIELRSKLNEGSTITIYIPQPTHAEQIDI
jgi:signal transduction histidine kinase